MRQVRSSKRLDRSAGRGVFISWLVLDIKTDSVSNSLLKSGVSISALLRPMAQSESPCSRTVVASLPTAHVLSVPNNCQSQYVAPERLRIELAIADTKSWLLTEDGAVVHWHLGADSLRKVADVFADPTKYFDSTIGEEPALWSWGVLPQSSPDKSLERTRDR